MNEIKKHVFVCVNERNERSPKGCCASKDSLEIMTQLKKLIKEKGVKDIRVNKSGCLCSVSYTNLRDHETIPDLVFSLMR